MNVVEHIDDGIDAAETVPSASDLGDGLAESLLWLGRRLPSAVGATGKLGRRAEAELRDALGADPTPRAISIGLGALLPRLGLTAGSPQIRPDAQRLPMVAMHPAFGYGLVYAAGEDGEWLAEFVSGRRRLGEWPADTIFLTVERKPDLGSGPDSARALFKGLIARDRLWIPMSALASALASLLVVGTSLYSMQVYDRVIGQGGEATLVVLTVGVAIAITIELALKIARSSIMDKATTRIDVEAAIKVFDRLARVRLDQFPPNVGTLAAQVRGFETVRAFTTARAVYLWTDAPFSLLFLIGIVAIGGPAMALVPFVFLAIAVAGGLAIRRGILRHSTDSTMVGNKRQGLLVEAVHGVEVVKAFGARWALQGRWNDLSRRGAIEAHEIKRLNDMASHLTGLVQQLSYVGIVATGAWLAVSDQSITTGAIIACSILSGRALAPISTLPGLLVQWAHAEVALDNLEKLFALEVDNSGQNSPIVPDEIRGRIDLKDLSFAWPGVTASLEVKSLRIAAGEKVGILGVVGAGKSTLLKLIAGSIKAKDGLVLLDGMDIQQICADRRAEAIGYLPQVSRLVSGTLRDNLTIGLPYVSDDAILRAAELTGLADHIRARPQGLDVPIFEAGEGVSRGQKQLIGLTRVILAKPELWLLDEPTASMDDATEERCLRALQQSLSPDHTLVLVTHKIRLLELVDRLIILTPRGVALDGPRDAILARIQQGNSLAEGQGRVVSAVRAAPAANGTSAS